MPGVSIIRPDADGTVTGAGWNRVPVGAANNFSLVNDAIVQPNDGSENSFFYDVARTSGVGTAVLQVLLASVAIPAGEYVKRLTLWWQGGEDTADPWPQSSCELRRADDSVLIAEVAGAQVANVLDQPWYSGTIDNLSPGAVSQADLDGLKVACKSRTDVLPATNSPLSRFTTIYVEVELAVTPSRLRMVV